MSWTAHLSVGLNFLPVSPLLTMAIEDYGINRVEAGLLVSLPLLFGAAMGIPGGLLVGRVGLRRSYFTAWLSIAVLALSAAAPNFYTLLVLRMAFGLGMALVITATVPLLMRWFSPRGMLVMNALNTGLITAGVAISLASAVPLAAVLDWKSSLSVFAGLAVIGAIAWSFAPGDPPRSRAEDHGIRLRDVPDVLRLRAVALLAAADAGILVQYAGMTGWLPTFFLEERGISPAEAGFMTSILPFVGMFAILAGGVLPFRLGSFRVVLLISGTMAIAGGLGAFVFAKTWAIYASMFVLGVGSWLYLPSLRTIPMRLPGMTPERVAVAWGCFTTFSLFCMFLSPILVGGLRDATGSFLPGFGICVAASSALLVAGLLFPRGAAGGDAPRIDNGIADA